MNRPAEKSPVSARAEAALAAYGQVLDEAQRAVLARLEDLRRRMLARNSVLARGLRLLPRAPAPLRGLYLWGGVGRGKTFLVDEFFAELPVREKRREHFHRLMQDVHARLRRHRNHPDPLAQVAADIAAKARILCIDEFVVSDIADAMILGTLLEALFRRGVTLVATSNLPPVGALPGRPAARALPPGDRADREALPGPGTRCRRRLPPAATRSCDALSGTGRSRCGVALGFGVCATRGRPRPKGRADSGRRPLSAGAARGGRRGLVRIPRTLRGAAFRRRLH